METNLDNTDKNDEKPMELLKEHISNDHSEIFGVSLRGWVSLILIVTVCAMSIMNIKVEEPLYSLVLTISSFYFGHQIASRSNKVE